MVSIPSLCHRPSRANVPPNGRESVNTSPEPAAAARASAGSNSRDSAATSRRTASRSSWSSRPKEYSTLVRETPAFASHSLCANCR